MSKLIPNVEGNDNILIVLDTFSKFIKLYPTKKTNTQIVKYYLKDYFNEIGLPNYCIMDNKTYFNNEPIKSW